MTDDPNERDEERLDQTTREINTSLPMLMRRACFYLAGDAAAADDDEDDDDDEDAVAAAAAAVERWKAAIISSSSAWSLTRFGGLAHTLDDSATIAAACAGISACTSPRSSAIAISAGAGG